ncbi:DegV family protein [Williamsia deligens]|uniref:DegV family protein n=1 Tax=Williamsia deligens TaxID=321325 RepID=A0ABW3G569_9NOCA|nr:DegV family protein [Williamsia deligens]MCP2195099.1 EDD domain protein, DegV family [Williamsia deligens]
MTVVVVTDSSSRLPAPIRELYDIRQVPLHVLTGDDDLSEGVDEIGTDVYDRPGTTTSGATPADLASVFESAVADSDGDGVVAVSMSRKLSGTWSSARLAAEKFPGRVRVVDSRSVGLAVGFATVAAAQAARAGGEIDRVYEAAIRAASTSETLVCVADLGRLRASGRIGAATRLFGTALSIKPVLRVVDGGLVLAERQRTFSKAIASMVSAAVAATDRQPTTVGVVHADAADTAAEVTEMLTDRLRVVTSTVVTDLGPVLTAHTGRGAVGVVVCPGLDPIEGYAVGAD